MALALDREALTIGRGASTDVRSRGIPTPARVYAQPQRIGGEWTLSDEGVFRNASDLNRARVTGRQRPRDRHVIQVGASASPIRSPARQSTTIIPRSRSP